MPIQTIDAGVLPQMEPEEGFVCMSFNVLLPNSEDGWWISKYYRPSTPPSQRAWSHRAKLIRELLLSQRPDVICLQEALEPSFSSDFAFLKDAGYACALHEKRYLRPATFWRADRYALVQAKSKNKTLVTLLRTPKGRRFVVVNCHLSAGPFPDRRMRELHEGLQTAQKIARAEGLDAVPTVVCGDFNTPSQDTAIRKLLVEGLVPPDYREPAYPDVPMSSKPKSQALGRFVDAYALAYGERSAPPTMVLPELQPLYQTADGARTAAFERACTSLFERFAVDGEMDRAAIDAWLTAINGRPDRGSERDAALRILSERNRASLLPEDLMRVYEEELQGGKYWGVHHDFEVCGVAPQRSGTLYEGRFDYLYCTESQLQIQAVKAPLDVQGRARILRMNDPLPNAWHPSDHLPIAAALRFADQR